MVVSDEHKFIYLATPRTGSTTIQAYLVDHGWLSPHTHLPNHGNAEYTRKYVGEEKWRSYRKVAFVRNPWDWYPSVLRRMQEHKRNHGEGPTLNGLADLLAIVRKGDCQQDWISDHSGNIVMDFVGRFEILEDEIIRLAGWLPIPEPVSIRNRYKPKPHYSTHYTEEWMIEKVAENEKLIIDTYGYTFERVGDIHEAHS